MLKIYQNKSIKDANNHSEAATYCVSWYLFTILDVWYKIEPDAKTTIPTLNHSPRLKAKMVPAIMRPQGIQKPMAKADFKKKSLF